MKKIIAYSTQSVLLQILFTIIIKAFSNNYPQYFLNVRKCYTKCVIHTREYVGIPLRTYHLSSREFIICNFNNHVTPNGGITWIRIQSRKIHKQKYSKQNLDPKRENI